MLVHLPPALKHIQSGFDAAELFEDFEHDWNYGQSRCRVNHNSWNLVRLRELSFWLKRSEE